MLRKILLSLLSGIVIFFCTWIYQNSSFSRSIEDGFFKKISLLWRYQLFPEPKRGADFVFVNTSKDLALVEDTADYGTVTVSDRSRIYQLIKQINAAPQKPLFTVLDIQFYYPYSIDPKVDTLLENELAKNNRVVIPVLKNADGNYRPPLYRAQLGTSEYTTYAAGFNKFKILDNALVKTIPVLLDETINGTRYRKGRLFALRKGQLCLSTIWPAYFLNNDIVKAVRTDTSLESASKNAGAKSYTRVSTQYYNLGEMLLDLEANPEDARAFFENKIVIIGSFADDVHATPVGQMSGPVLLANLYLSILNGQHIVSTPFLILLIVVFSALSYVAWFSKMPKVTFREDVVPSYLSKLVAKYLTYFGCMFFLSLISIFVFNLQLALFFPSLVFAEIEMREQTKKNLLKFVSFFEKRFSAIRSSFKSTSIKR